MEKMVSDLLAAGLRVYFHNPKFVQVILHGTEVWWSGSTIEQVYETAKKKGYVK